MDTSLITPSVDMSSFSSAAIRFNQDYLSLGDNADVEVSTDGGSSWTTVLAQTTDQRGPRLTSIDITDLAAGESDVKVRFHNYNANWAWWWQVDNIFAGQAGCTVGTGGLVVGTVVDGGTGEGINGATVTNLGGDSTTTFATPDPGAAGRLLHPVRGSRTAGLRGLLHRLSAGRGQRHGGPRHDASALLRALSRPTSR